MSKAALRNKDRARELRELEVDPRVAARLGLEPGTRAYQMGGCRILCSKQRAGWHLTISRPNRLPSWEDVRDARYALLPDECVMAMLLPPRAEYVNVHEYCLQLYEIPRAYIDEHQDRL